MWVRRADYEALVRDRASLESEVQSKKGQIARLELEIDYWRGKFEREQERADRVNDRLMESNGFAPVSDTGIKEADGLKKQYEELMKSYTKQATEMFADEVPGMENAVEGGVAVDSELLSAIAEGFKG